MKRSTIKPKPCSECNSIWHSKGYHKPKKTLRKEAVKTKHKRQSTTTKWFKANPPDELGYWYCYIPQHPLCPKRLTTETINLEHDLSKARRPDLKHDIDNIFPACGFDNKAKGSKSAEEYMNEVSI